MRKEIERALGKGPRTRDVLLALSIGSAAIDEDRPDVAVEVLAWAKHQAPRLAVVREAYGVALYLAERYAEALAELQAYRRLRGSNDQNHLIADCLRALDRGLDRVAAAAEELLADPDAPEDRRAEAAIVWASAAAEDGAIPVGRSILRRYLDARRGHDDDHDLDARYVAADLAARDGDLGEARRLLEAVAAVDPDLHDVTERLLALDGERAEERDRGQEDRPAPSR